MTEQSTVRERVVVAASAMLAQHGLNATSIRETIKRAEAPLGSTYHHFPGGKHQLVVEAVELAGAHARGLTSVDWAGLTDRPANVDLVMEVDFERFWRLMQASVA